MKPFLPLTLALLLTWMPGREAFARQADTTLVQDAVYNRPFISNVGATSVGGYLEGNTNYFSEDGVTEGFSMELRRFNIFLFSAISPRVKFISELEFEHGTEEINLETALIDFQINPSLVVRGGILLVPIGAFNANHDAPLWDFVERPLVSTEIIPSTLSEVGLGLNGKFFPRPFTLSYDVYLTNGLGDGIILNDTGRTHLAAGKREAQFAEDNNGSPALSGRVALRHPRLGEAGLSYYGGIYNRFRIEGEEVDERRHYALYAADFNTTISRISLQGEAALARVDVPEPLREVFGERQVGFYLDAGLPVWTFTTLGYQQATLGANVRVERVDFNRGTFAETGLNRFDEVRALTAALAFRPTPNTVFRLNYRNTWFRDLLGNPTVRTAGYQFGLATYF